MSHRSLVVRSKINTHRKRSRKSVGEVIMDPDIGKSMDRISNLPDALLCHILSFLSTKYAVGTSILSTRWQYLWTFVPNLDFDQSQLFHEYSLLSEDRRKQVDMMFVYFVSRVLMRFNDAPYLRKFILRIDSLDVPELDLDFDLVDTWISAAIIRNIQDLELHNLIENNVMLPDCLFTSKTLATLTLCEVFLDVPDLVRLPNLKILNLDSVEYEDEDSLQKLFSGCPVLEQLNLERCILDKQQVVSVSVSTLKRLKVVWYRECFVLDESDDLVHKLVVDAPQLERFYLRDNVSNEFLFRNLSSLSEASFCVGPPFYGSNNNNSSDDAFCIYKLLSGTSNVKLLDAYFSCQADANDYVLPTFHNLTQLNFGAAINSNWNLKLLADFLRCSPNLEVLILKGSYYNNTAKSWNPPQEVPSCLLFHLKKIEFKEFSGNDCELEVIEYLLKNSIVLKKMIIDCQYSDECFCGQLAVYPRGSMTCRLNLLI